MGKLNRFILISLLTMAGAVAHAKNADVAEKQEPMLSWSDATVLGIVEGVTEYLPISSTGHLILTSYALGLIELEPDAAGSATATGTELVKPETLDSFQIVIQIGAILAVLGLYRKRVGQMIRGCLGRDRQGLRLAMMLIVAFLPAAILGPLLHGTIQHYLFGPMTVAWALLVGGIVMIGANRLHRHRDQNASIADLAQLTWRRALIIGLFQVLAMWPGTSRSMVTILGGMAVGMNMVAAAEFSFLLALPTLGGATVYELLGSGTAFLNNGSLGTLIIGTLVSAIVAAVAVYWFVRWLTRHGLLPFAIYRIVLALIFIYILR